MFLVFSFVSLYFLGAFEGIFCTSHGEARLFIVTNRGEENPSTLDRNVTDPLQMTCYLVGDDDKVYKLRWKVPDSVDALRFNIHNVHQKGSNLTINFRHLFERNSGKYVCIAFGNDLHHHSLQQPLELNVHPRMSDGCEKKFFCAPHKCIHPRFECDGKVDCDNGADENINKCGPNPCEGKIQCEGRCIPVAWCCFPDEPNCTTKNRPPCCPSRIDYEGHYYIPTTDSMESLKPAIVLVIGFAVMFIIMVTAVVIAVCRVLLRRSMLSSIPQRRDILSNTRYHRSFSHDVGIRHLGVYMSRGHIPGNLLVTYNINNGVQFLEEVLDPPPYNEVVQTVPREDPPPPYSATDECNGRITTLSSVRNSPKPDGLPPPPDYTSSMPNQEVPSSNAQLRIDDQL